MKTLTGQRAWVLGASLTLFLFCLPAFSQLNLGRVLGTVKDQTGRAVVGATVTVTDQERGVSRVLTTDIAGAFAAPGLIPGTYSIQVKASGFNPVEHKDIVVQSGSDSRVDLVVQAGSQTQTITVTSQAPLVNTTSATLGGVLAGKTINQLPMIGNSYQTLLQYRPGIATRPGGGPNGHSSNGMRNDFNNWLFEGIFSGGVRTAGSIINTNSHNADGATIVPPDAIEEFNVQLENKAEYGWRPGAAVNVNIKSGTNSIHGTAFALGQSGDINARNPFLGPNDPNPSMDYEQYGGTVGGPVIKDKLFYFGAFEGMRYTVGNPAVLADPTTALVPGDTAGSIPAAYLDMAAKGQINPDAIDASGKVVDPSLLSPQQQLSAHMVDLGLFQTTASPSNDDAFPFHFSDSRFPTKNILGKIDYHVNDHNNITGTYFYGSDRERAGANAALQPYWLGILVLQGQVARASWTWVPNSQWVNEAHFGYDRKIENTWPSECDPGAGVTPPDYGFNTGAQSCLGAPDTSSVAFPTLTISGFAPLGMQGSSHQRRVEWYWSGVDNVSYTSGNHALKFGVELRNPHFSGADYSAARGSISFGTSGVAAFSGATALEDFLMGVPSTGTILTGDPTVDLSGYSFGTFIQDDWRVTPRLTLNLGLRYEFSTAVHPKDNKMAQFDPVLGLVQLGTDGLNALWHADVLGNNLQPRFGLAWDVTGKGTTVLRAGVGIYGATPVWNMWISVAALQNNPTGAIFYAPDGTATPGTGTIASGNVSFDTAKGNPPTPLLNWTLAGPIFPTAGTIGCGNGLTVPDSNPVETNPGPCSAAEVDRNWHLPFYTEWNLGIEHQFTSNVSLDVAYVGNHGSSLLGTYDINMPTPGTNSKSREQLSRPYYDQYPYLGQIIYLTNKDFSNYNGLQMTLTQRAWHGLSYVAGYTFSHALDFTYTDIHQTIPVNPACPYCEYGPTRQDSRNRFTLQMTYLVPGKQGFGQLLEGWQISSLVNLMSAFPWNPIDKSNDLSGTHEKTDRWNLIGNASDFNGYGHFVSIPCYGITGSKFGRDPGCTTVDVPGGAETAADKVANMPAACITAAAGLPTNPDVPSSDPNATGLAALSNLGCYVSGSSVIVPPAQGTFGNMSRNMLRGAGTRLWDMSIRKTQRFGERVSVQLQFDVFNVTNSPQFKALADESLVKPGIFGRATGTPNGGNVLGSGDARRYQFGLKLIF